MYLQAFRNAFHRQEKFNVLHDTEREANSLTTESVEGSSLTLESVDDIERGHSLSLGVFGVRHRVTDDRLEESLEDSTGLLVDEARDTLNTSTTSQSTNSGLGDSYLSMCISH